MTDAPTPRVLGEHVLVRRDAPKTQIGSILIPEVAGKDWPQTGEVIAVGARVSQDCPPPGARVYFRSRPASAFIQDDRIPDQHKEWDGLVRLLEEDLLAVIE